MPGEKAPSYRPFLPASLMHFCSGKPMHFSSGVDSKLLLKNERISQSERRNFGCGFAATTL